MSRKLASGALVTVSALVAVGMAGAASAEPRSAGSSGVSAAAKSAQTEEISRVKVLRSTARQAAPRIARSLALSRHEKLKIRDVTVGRDGTRHLRYDRTYDGLRVIGGDLIVHQKASGAVESVTWAHKGALRLGTTDPQVSRTSTAKAAERKAESLTEDHGRRSGELRSAGDAGRPRLVVWAATGKPALAWDTVVRGVQSEGAPSELHVISDAATGKVLTHFEGVKGAADDAGVHVGTVELSTSKGGGGFVLKDDSRGGATTVNLEGRTNGSGKPFSDEDDKWGDGTPGNPQSAAVDAHFGSAATWDYYKSSFNRNGIFNDGKGSVSRVHYGKGFVNAFWDDSCRCMTYGDGEGDTQPLTSLDVAGHEMSHGVTSATADLIYEGESGGLNEATSDILGTGVEWKSNIAADVPDYLIGEEIDIRGDGSPLRYMDKPSKDGQSADYWSADVGGLDVHFSSGVANHFYYLLSEGSGKKTINGVEYDSPTKDGSTVAGIGHEKAEAIWYTALTTYFTSTTDYKGAREGTLKAATDLYGADSAEAKAVAAAWTAVNVS